MHGHCREFTLVYMVAPQGVEDCPLNVFPVIRSFLSTHRFRFNNGYMHKQPLQALIFLFLCVKIVPKGTLPGWPNILPTAAGLPLQVAQPKQKGASCSMQIWSLMLTSIFSPTFLGGTRNA